MIILLFCSTFLCKMPMSCIKFKLLCWINYYLPQRKVMFSEASVSYSKGVSLQEGRGLPPGGKGSPFRGKGSPSRGYGVSLQAEGSTFRGWSPSRRWGCPSRGEVSLQRGISLQREGGLPPGVGLSPPFGRYASNWNAFLFSHLVSWFSRMSSYYVK